MSRWHRFVHFMGWHRTFRDMYGDNDGYVYTGDRCETCGKVERPIQMWRIEESDRALKSLFGR